MLDEVILINGKFKNLLFYHSFYDRERAENGWAIPEVPLRVGQKFSRPVIVDGPNTVGEEKVLQNDKLSELL